MLQRPSVTASLESGTHDEKSVQSIGREGDFAVRTVHRLEPLEGGGTRVVYRTEITGAAADQVGPELGPAITADFPQVLAALVHLAEG